MASLQHVLLVDDEPDIRLIARTALECRCGFRVRECERGAEAVAAALEERPGLIVLDVMMPEMDGTEVIRALQAEPELADVPVVFMTAKVQRRECERYLELGALGLIAKPFDPMTLGDELRALWNRRGAAAARTR